MISSCVICPYLLRFDPIPEAGESRGLDLILDAHTDLVTASSVTKPFQVILVNPLSLEKHDPFYCFHRGLRQ